MVDNLFEMLREAVRAKIKAERLPVAVAARQIGIAQPMLHKVYNGEQADLSLRTAAKICAWLGWEMRPLTTVDADRALDELGVQANRSGGVARHLEEVPDKLAELVDLEFVPANQAEASEAVLQAATEHLQTLEQDYLKGAAQIRPWLDSVVSLRLAADKALAKARKAAKAQGRTRRKTTSPN
jgi:hypothetical protein